MSTEATADGRTDAGGPATAGIAEASVAVEGAEPTATAVVEPEAEPQTAAEPEYDQAGGPGAGGQPASDDAPQPGESVAAARQDEFAPLTESPAASDQYPGGPGYDDLSSGDYDEYEDTGEDYDEQYDAYAEPEPAGSPRPRRWPRVLLGFGFVVLAVVIVGGAIAIVGSVTHGFKQPVKITYTKSHLFALQTGECFDPQGQSFTSASCDSPHQAEVFATFTLSGSKWPGDAAIAAAARSGCSTRLTGYLNPQLAISLSQAYVYPDSVAWKAGTRKVICEVQATTGNLTGSVRSASVTAG